MLNLAFLIQLEQLVDSALPSTREFWRRKYFNATDQEATDPRPFIEVLKEREHETAGKGN